MLNNQFEYKRPDGSVPESEEERKKRLEEAQKLKEAREFSDAKVAEIAQPGVAFDTRRPDDRLVVEAAKAGINPIEAPKPPETHMSNTAQAFLNRFEQSKSVEESIAIMNEVLAASESGKIPPNEANELLDHGNATGTIMPS